MDTSDWIALAALIVSGLAVWRAFRTDAKVEAAKQPIVKLSAGDHETLDLSVRNMADVKLSVSRLTVLWPPGGKLMETTAPLPADNGWKRSLDPRLALMPRGTKGNGLIIGTSDEHQVSLRFWPTSPLFWRLSRWSRRARRSGQISSLTILRIHLIDDRDRITRLTRRAVVTIHIPANGATDAPVTERIKW